MPPKSEKQRKFMLAVLHDEEFAKKVNVDQETARKILYDEEETAKEDQHTEEQMELLLTEYDQLAPSVESDEPDQKPIYLNWSDGD